MVVDRDSGMSLALDLLEDLGVEEPGVLIGIRSAEDEKLVTYATANEFGTKHVPERSFLRSTMDRHAARYGLRVERAILRAVDTGSRTTLEQGFTDLGIVAVGDVQQTITDLKDPPNAPSTIRKKAKRGKLGKPLIDSGRMRQSITFELDIGGSGVANAG